MLDQKLIVAGFGGQGILFLGKVLSYAGLLDGKEVSWLPSYGPEMRGGTANCSVCVSDEPIASPLVIEPDVLVALNNPSLEKFIGAVVPGGTVIVDATLVTLPVDRQDVAVFRVPATKLAQDQGLKGLANMILLGKLQKEGSLFSDEALKEGIKKSVPPRKTDLIESNLKAIEIGKET